MTKWNSIQIKNAVRLYNNYIGHAVIMCDESSGSVWTDLYAYGEILKKYSSCTIYTVASKNISCKQNMNVRKLGNILRHELYKQQKAAGL